MRREISLILVSLILGLCLVGATKIISDTVITVKNKGYIKVKGFAKEKIKSDVALLKIKIKDFNKDLTLCYKNVEETRKELNDIFSNFKIDKINIYPIKLEEKFKINERGYETEEFVGYRLTQDIEIETKDVEGVQELVRNIERMLSKGREVEIVSLKYICTKLDDLKIKMIGKATRNALERAKTVAHEGKFALGPISSVRVGVFQITPLYSTRISDYGINDTQSLWKEIKSVVEVKFFVK